MFWSRGIDRIIIPLLLALSVLYGIAVLLQIFLKCHPLSAAWDPNANGACGNETLAYVLLESFGLFIDLLIMVVPIFRISQLDMSLKTRWKVGSVFSLGGL